MQLVNASTYVRTLPYGENTHINIGANVVRLNANTTWAYPFVPGGTAYPVRQQMVVCIPSNLTIASACCSAAGGTSVLPDLTNERLLNSTQLLSLLDAKYPFRNNTQTGIGGALNAEGWVRTTIGDLDPTTNATNTTSTGMQFNWCSLPYNPLSTTDLGTITRSGFQSGEYYGRIPESVLKWRQCFNSSVPAGEVEAGRAAYVCVIDDLREGGTIQGYAQYRVSGAERVGVKIGWIAVVLSVLLVMI